MTNIHLNTK